MSDSKEPMPNLQEAYDALRLARDTHEDLKQKAAIASSAEIGALNRLNDAQKAFDQVVAAIKTNAPRESDWSRQLTKRVTP